MLQNIIDNLKNQGIEPDLAQSNLIEELNNTSPKNNTSINKIKKYYNWDRIAHNYNEMLENI